MWNWLSQWDYEAGKQEAAMEIRLMGDVELHDGARPIPLLRAGERGVLASFALEPGRRIHVDTLIERLWGERPPTGAGPTIASYIRTVRKAIEDAGGRREWLRNHRPFAYQLDIEPSLIDYHRFTALISEARTRQRGGKPAAAVASYQQALGLRRAEPLGNVTGQWAVNRRFAIEQEYLEAVYALYERQLTIGEYAAVAIHATELVLNVVPTDRMIVLAIYGMARSGQHAAISDFLDRATQRMWDIVQARPSSRVFAIARQLIDNPNARLPTPQPPPADLQPPGQPHDDKAAAPSSHAGREPSQADPGRGGLVVMTAEYNQQVYQAAGDQYISGA
jgi:DNA-binding SARP family transcriptional activator